MNAVYDPETYECAACGETFIKGWSEAEALAEYETSFAQLIDAEPVEVVCDDCYRAMMHQDAA